MEGVGGASAAAISRTGSKQHSLSVNLADFVSPFIRLPFALVSIRKIYFCLMYAKFFYFNNWHNFYEEYLK
ncbi:MAG: hypothetical protein F6K08_02870 [Okeania sp. SIO1H6]|nr:hypothetical protein [Okeania sp. SIO1H6]